MLRKISYVWPVVSVIGLSVIGIVILNPSININKVHAEDDAVVYEVEPYELTDDGVILEWDDRDSDYQSVSGNSSEVLYRYNRFKVTADNIEKYQILANIMDTANGSNGNKLIGYTNSQYNITNGYSIDAITNENGIKGSSLQSSTVSQWGYNISVGDISTASGLANLVYKAVPTATQSTVGLTDTVESLNNQTFTIAFAANIADDKPAGSYRASVGVSVVVEPKVVVTWDNIQYMQQMTPEICASQSTPTEGVTNVPTKTLTDNRDGSTYTIAKLKSGRCWMTQNLRLVNKKLTPEDSDVEVEFELPASVTLSSNDNPKKFSSSDRFEKRVYYAGNTKYGAYYNWFTATAGTGDANKTSGDASSSICPKGWKLPIGKYGEYDASGEFGESIGFLKSADAIKVPYLYVYSGFVSDGTLVYAGTYGNYWSSTAYPMVVAYELGMSSFTDSVVEAGVKDRYYGFSVRCIARLRN